MRIYLTILCFITICQSSFGQKYFTAFFYQDSVIINNEIVEMSDTIRFRLTNNTTNRLIVWKSKQNKVAVLYKLKGSKRRLKSRKNLRLKTKSRVETFESGKWQKPKLEIKFIERRILKATRWESWSKSKWSRNFFVKNRRTTKSISTVFVGDNGEIIKVVGRFEFLY